MGQSYSEPRLEKDYILHIKDGKDQRMIKVPREGLRLIYVTGANQPEEIYIPPR